MANTPREEFFADAAIDWELSSLYSALAVAKREFAPHKKPELTEKEKQHLCGLLCGYSPGEIAEKLHKSARGLDADLCNTIYRYVEQLTRKPANSLKNWRDIPGWLEGAGYKKNLSKSVKDERALMQSGLSLDIANPISQDIEILVQKVRSHFDKTIQNECETLCTFNLLYSPMQGNLSQIYVQTKLNESQQFSKEEFSQERRLWEEVVRRNPKLMVLGKPGVGKTTLLQYIAVHCDEVDFQSKLIPIFISLRTLAKRASNL
ncbi:hypothetical protein [Calothrix anomala]|nr:hypothetical protein [Calothrix anomala]